MKPQTMLLRGINPASREVPCGVDWLRAEADAGRVPCLRDVYGRRFFDENAIAIARNIYRARTNRAGSREA